jgi:hypothetical protein
LLIDRLAYTFGNEPVERRVSQCNTTDYHYLSELN